MLFNSIDFIVFLLVVVFTYYKTNANSRWLVLLVASYFFYMCWKPQYAILIMFSTLLDYWCGIMMSKKDSQHERKPYLWLSIVSNLGLLFTFKYLDFFVLNINEVTGYSFSLFDLVLPMGISFYTFQTLSYSIDIYKGDIKAEKHLGKFALYVTFFPQLVAGPIERASRLLPQFSENKKFSYGNVISGSKQIIWGLFKKVVIADRLSLFVNEIFNNPTDHYGIIVVLGTLAFAIQIYCDFSGYSNIAIGAAKIMGYDLMENFNTPYFSSSFKEFWKRWHISLSQWFQDYVYIPLGGNKVVKWRWHYNLFITFLISGFWHGSNWTFIVWGVLHGLYLVVENSIAKQNKQELSIIGKFFKVLVIFTLVCFAWIFFRANNVHEALTLIGNIFDFNSWPTNEFAEQLKATNISLLNIVIFTLSIPILIIYDTLKFKRRELKSFGVNSVFYMSIIFFILCFGYTGNTEFIYFQF